MNQKKYLLAIFMAIVMIASIPVVFPADTPILKLTLLRYEPTPAKPGDYITAYVQVENIGGGQAKNAKIAFVPNYPFSVDQVSDGEKIIGKIEVGQIYIAEMKIRVDINAVYGSNDLKFFATDDYLNPSAQKIDKVFSVQIQSRDSDLEIEKVEINPVEINPGDSGKISITIKNNAGVRFSDVKSKISLFVQTGSSVVDLPFAVKDSVTDITIGNMDSGEEKTFSYDLLTYPTITPGIYKLPIVFTYFDGTGQNFSKTKYVTLKVNPKIDVYMVIDASQITKEVKTGQISIKIVNKGLGGIKLTNLKIGTSDSFDLLSTSSESYIGNIDSDDYKSADFVVSAKKDKLSIPVSLTFKDALNQEHEITSNLDLNVLSQNTLTPKKTSYTGLIILIIVIVAGVVFYLRRKKKK